MPINDLVYDVGMNNGDDSIEALNLDLRLLDKLAALGYSRFKCVEQSTFLPMEFPPVPEQHAVERAKWLLMSSKFPHRLFRKLGGRLWLQQQLQSTRRYHTWTFPPESSGGFGDQTLGRWLRYDEMRATLKEFLRRRHSGEKSIFWIDDKSWGIWADLHAQYVEHPDAPTLQSELAQESRPPIASPSSGISGNASGRATAS
jgi:hypothetical protein